jgi:hypothetical protein
MATNFLKDQQINPLKQDRELQSFPVGDGDNEYHIAKLDKYRLLFSTKKKGARPVNFKGQFKKHRDLFPKAFIKEPTGEYGIIIAANSYGNDLIEFAPKAVKLKKKLSRGRALWKAYGFRKIKKKVSKKKKKKPSKPKGGPALLHFLLKEDLKKNIIAAIDIINDRGYFDTAFLPKLVKSVEASKTFGYTQFQILKAIHRISPEYFIKSIHNLDKKENFWGMATDLKLARMMAKTGDDSVLALPFYIKRTHFDRDKNLLKYSLEYARMAETIVEKYPTSSEPFLISLEKSDKFAPMQKAFARTLLKY